MAKLRVDVAKDHLARLGQCSLRVALAELIWNALDADAESVTVTFEFNALGVPSRVQIDDDGGGIDHRTAVEAFSKVGNSWKRTAGRTEGQRKLHGQEGKGRFRAFALGHSVRWTSTFRDESGRFKRFEISGRLDDLREFEISEPEPIDAVRSGTVVVVEDPAANVDSVLRTESFNRLTAEFALYLAQYPDVAVTIADERLDPSSLVTHRATYDCTVDTGTAKVRAEMKVVEWSRAMDRQLLLCDEQGFALHHLKPGIQASGFHFTAYLCTDHFRSLASDATMELAELDGTSNLLADRAKELLRAHFRERSASRAAGIREKWRSDNVYPYDFDAEDTVARARQDVFDICAFQVHSYLPGFDRGHATTQRLVFRLLRQAVEENPTDLERILVEVLQLPEEKRADLAALLDKTSLSAIISVSHLVANRLEFIEGLENLVFDPVSKSLLKERTQLHKILEGNTWLFGEEFNLAMSDQSLTEALRIHLTHLQREEGSDDFPEVVRADGTRGILDLMLARSIPRSSPHSREFLVVELKRPSKKVDTIVLNQIKSYAQAVARDARFAGTDTTWNFLAVSTELDEMATIEATQDNRPVGLVLEHGKLNLRVWAKPWAQIFREAKGRLQRFQNELKYSVDAESALDHIRRHYGNLIPAELKIRSTEIVGSVALGDGDGSDQTSAT